jgi:hypothetical protein
MSDTRSSSDPQPAPIPNSGASVTDAVNHPAYYGGESDPFETIKVIEAWSLNFNIGSCVKYLSRAGKKGDRLEDLRKAAWYLNREIAYSEQIAIYAAELSSMKGKS